MSDDVPNFDFLNYSDEAVMDVFAGEYNFNLNNDVPIEDNLSRDYPGEGAQQAPVPEVSSPTPLLNSELNSQPQFVDPRTITHTPLPLQPTGDFSNVNMTDTQWVQNELANLGSDQLMMATYAQNPPMPGFAPHLNNNQLGFNQFAQFANLGMPQQLMGYSPNMAPMGFVTPYANGPIVTSTPMCYQQTPQQPMHSGYQAPFDPPLPVIHEPSAQGSVHQSPTQSSPQRAPKRKRSPDRDSRNSTLPTMRDRSRHSKQPPSPGTTTTGPRPKRPAKNHNGESLRNDRIPRKTHGRKGNIHVEPEKYYGPSPPKPPSWGPRNSRGEHLFTYTEKGELAAGLFLTTLQMRWYLMGPNASQGENFDPPTRLPGVKYAKNKIRQGLTLWIGWPAAMTNVRYPRAGESTKCRFEDCRFGEHRTIATGQPRVIFDERQNVDGEMIDPFHNAGYVHLWCLESHFDLITLWHFVDIRPDYRSWKRESHPYFSLEHKLNGVDSELRNWWIATYEKCWEAKRQGKKRERDHESSLTNCLVNFKLEGESVSITKTREKRKGNDLAKHKGDPQVKKKYALYKQFGLLDENGYPTKDAAAQLESLQSLVQGGTSANPIMGPATDHAGSSQQILVWNENQAATPTHNNTLPNLAHQAPNRPKKSRGRKRGHEEDTTDSTITPSPKRPRIQPPPATPQTPPTLTQPDAAVTPVPPLASIGNADFDTQGEGESYTELLAMDTDMDIDIDDPNLFAEFQESAGAPPGEEESLPDTKDNPTVQAGPDGTYNTEVSRSPSSSTGPREPSPTFSKEAHINSEDVAELFGEDTDDGIE
ncbi:hypothetical protein F5Y08DRAFT_63271 [Xylaria arbuscula]|nr:hypothetical protein F5Y08DRAFT_63271 [Xylaria arbuscula]